LGSPLVRTDENHRRSRGHATQEAWRSSVDRDRTRRWPSIGPAFVRRRLLFSYLALTAVILLLLELPLGVLYARRERDALTSVARRDAAVLAAVAAESLENPGHDLHNLATQYQAETGAEVAVFDSAGRTLVSLDPDDPTGSNGPDFDSAVAAALKGRSTIGRDSDDDGPEF